MENQASLRTQRRRIQNKISAAISRIRNASNSSKEIKESSATSDQLDNSENQIPSLIEYRSLDPGCNQLEQIIPEVNSEPTKIEIFRNVVLKHRISHVAINELLENLQIWLPNENFPKDARTLLKTPRSVQSTEIGNGWLYYFGMETFLTQKINLGLKNNVSFDLPNLKDVKNLISLKVGTDGVSVSKSSNVMFWPLLASIDQDPVSEVFIISLFYGKNKPNSLDEFLRPFVNEMLHLESGFFVNGILYHARIRCIIADAPARSFIKCVRQHNSYYACERCYLKGKWNRKVIHKARNGTKFHSDYSFKAKTYKKHHLGTSPLTELQVGMISQIPIDPMHCIYLGVMRKLLYYWTQGPLNFRLSPKERLKVSNDIKLLSKFIPSDFNRRPRGLEELKNWKATEFRTFLLYLGPYSLKDVLPKSKYRHFLKLHLATYILASFSWETNANAWLDYAESLLLDFVNEGCSLYGEEFLVYNVHCLTHIVQDVRIHGRLDQYSAFDFETYMMTLKKFIRTNHSHLVQVVKRVAEIQASSFRNCKQKTKLNSRIKLRDSCFVTSDRKFCRVEKMEDNRMLVDVIFFSNIKPYYKNPCNSEKFRIVLAKLDCAQRKCQITASNLKQKCFCMPVKDKWLIIPLCSSTEC